MDRTPRWYLWDGASSRWDAVRVGFAPRASRDQIVVVVEGTVGIRGKRGDWRMAPGVIVRPDAVHSYNGNGAVGAMVFVDPESAPRVCG
jgi:hypothetical protein